MILPPPDRRLTIVVFAIVVALVVVLAGAPGTAKAAEREMPVHVDTRAYPEVALTFDAPPGSVDALTVATVLEAGRPRVATIRGGGHGGVELVLVFDTSSSMAGSPLAAAQAAASAFVRRIPPGTKVAVVGYGDRAAVVSPMTADTAALEEAIGGLGAAGESALYDALSLAAEQFTTAKVPRTILLVSDGGANAGKSTIEAVTAKLTADGIRLYSVQLLTSEIAPTLLDVAVSQRTALDELAVSTHGRTVDALHGDALPATYELIGGEVARRVRLSYRSNAHGTTPVEVRLTNGSAVRSLSMSVPLPTVTERAPLVGGIAVFVALVTLGALTFLRPRRSLLAANRRSLRSRPDGLRAVKGKAGALMERTLERRGRRQALGVRLENAGLALRPGEYVVLAAGSTGLGVVFGVLLRGIGLGLVMGAVVLLVVRLLLSSRTTKRRAELERQLPDFLQQVTSGLRAGYGVMQAVDAVSREIDAPMSDELRRLVAEVQLGRDLSESLNAMAGRVGGQDFEWVIQAIEINREVGGDLVEVLEAVGNTIRARDHLRRQVKTLSAQGRLSARILLAMPFVMAGILSLLNPGYLAPLVQKSAGPVLLGMGAALMTTGWFWLRRIVRPEF